MLSPKVWFTAFPIQFFAYSHSVIYDPPLMLTHYLVMMIATALLPGFKGVATARWYALDSPHYEEWSLHLSPCLVIRTLSCLPLSLAFMLSRFSIHPTNKRKDVFHAPTIKWIEKCVARARWLAREAWMCIACFFILAPPRRTSEVRVLFDRGGTTDAQSPHDTFRAVPIANSRYRS